jgi:alkanesulfonate monooxygenase SsuD/methylene tetrahydromethanopterin reductase-like flavin-dependent oxidoreductase (luciferase family)
MAGMRIGLMIGSDKERPRRERLSGLVTDVQEAEQAGFTSVWVPQVPGYLDAMAAIAVLGLATDRIELGTSVMPIQSRHPVPMAQQALTTQMACDGRFALGLGASHHWIVQDQWGLTYDRPARQVRDYLEVLDKAFAGPGPVDVENDAYRVHSPMDVTDERAIAEHVVPRVTKAATEAGRPAPRIVAGVPVAACPSSAVESARQTAREVLGHADFSPNYERLLDHGDAEDVDDVMAVGDESAIAERLRSYRDAGVTDLAARIVPLGDDAEARTESKRRTQDLLATLTPEL